MKFWNQKNIHILSSFYKLKSVFTKKNQHVFLNWFLKIYIITHQISPRILKFSKLRGPQMKFTKPKKKLFLYPVFTKNPTCFLHRKRHFRLLTKNSARKINLSRDSRENIQTLFESEAKSHGSEKPVLATLTFEWISISNIKTFA